MERIKLNTFQNQLYITEFKNVNQKALERARQKKLENEKYRKENNLIKLHSLTLKQVSKIKDIAVYLKYTQTKNSKINFWTLTTQQTNNNMTDLQISKQLSKIFDNYIKQGIITKRYIWVAERQKNGSLHYHIIVEQLKKVDFKKVVKYLNTLFHLTGTNVINIKSQKDYDNSLENLKEYMTKQMREYITKEGKKENTKKQYFVGKASRISNTLNQEFEANKDNYIISTTSFNIDYEQLSIIIENIKPFTTEFSYIYKLNKTQTKKIQNLITNQIHYPI
jgi:hypothetical protein